MASESEKSPGPDYEETTSFVQGDGLEGYTGSQLEESYQVDESLGFDFDRYAPPEEASGDGPEGLGTDVLHAIYKRNQGDQGPEDALTTSFTNTHDTLEAGQMSDELPPAAGDHVSQISRGLDQTQHSNDVVNHGPQSPVIKLEEVDDDVVILISSNYDEPIVISDDEDVLELHQTDPVVDAYKTTASNRTTNQLPGDSEELNLGASILRTRTRRKPTKEQVEMMKRAQQTLAEQSTRKTVMGGAGNVFKGVVNKGDVAPEAETTAPEHDENAWMNEEIEENSDDSLLISKLKKKITSKLKKQQPVLAEEIELINAEKKRAIRSRRHRNDATYEIIDDDEENGLFISKGGNEHKRRKIARDASLQYNNSHDPAEYDLEGHDTAVGSPKEHRNKPSENDEEQELTRRQQSPLDEGDRVTRNLLMALNKDTDEGPKKKSRKKRSTVAKTAREAHEKNRNKAKPSNRSKPQKVNSKAKPTKQAKAATMANANVGANKAPENKAGPKRAAGGYGTSGDSSDLLMDLLYNNAIANRLAQGDLGDAPVITEKKSKARMLKELMASVPSEVSRHVASDKKDLLQASKRFGHGKVKAVEGKWILNVIITRGYPGKDTDRTQGMVSPLYHHQLLGADFMVGRECGTIRPFGGLLADGMGLGKTLEMLATMVGNPPTPQEARHSKITLLVVPGAVIRQWQNEIVKHVKSGVFKKIMHYKAKKDISMEILQDCDILITSYSEVMNSYPWPNQHELKTLNTHNIAQWTKDNWNKRGQLHHLQFYRVVLDEAHSIKNHRSRTSIACATLTAGLRWALTGTPILNRLEELYPYFRFLSVQYTSDFQTFKREFCDPNSVECQRRVFSLLSYMMIRRTLQDKIFDRPIVELPKTHPDTKKIDFSKEERALYQILEDRFRRDFNSYFEAGTAQKNYRNIVVKLLRLRQCTAHPFLLHQTIKDIFTLEDLRNLEVSLARANPENRPIYDQIGVWVRSATAEKASQGRSQSVNTPTASSETDGGVNFGKSNFGNNFDFVKYLSTLDERTLLARCICGICADVAEDPTITDCNHVFCRECIQTECDKAAAQSDFTECPVCHSAFGSSIPFEDLKARQHVPTDASDEEESQESGGRRRKGIKKSDGPWLNLPGELLPSAKTIAFKQQVLQWNREAPNDKIVVFTQFNLMAKIIAKICEGEGWPFVMYTGEMKQQAREKAVLDFGAPDSNVKIMIAGLKCGGQGLNLTMANRVISIDLWWNHSVELQAFGRVFRIGQHKETHLTRIVIRNTVDDRLLKMQEDKIRVVDGAMMDDGRKVKPLTVDELASLFGFLSRDEEGHTVVEPQDDDATPLNDPPHPSHPE